MTKKENTKLINLLFDVYRKGAEGVECSLDDSLKEILKAINYTRCCKSDSEQLIAFSDWVFEQPLHLGGNERKLVKQYLEGN